MGLGEPGARGRGRAAGAPAGAGSWSWTLRGLARRPQAFHVVFEKAIQRTVPADEVRQRVTNLTDEITYSVYVYTARGLFERDKLIFLAQVTFQVLPRHRRRCSPGAGWRPVGWGAAPGGRQASHPSGEGPVTA